MGGTSRFMKQESAFLHVLCTQESCSSVAGSPTTRPQLLLHLASSCSSCPVPKPVKALYCWEFLVTLISICSFYPPHTSVNSTFAKFSQDPSRVCLLFPAGSLTDMRMTWDEKIQGTSPARGGPPGTFPSPWQVCPWSIPAFGRATAIEF